jgi:L-fucose isomerase-like protein
MVHEKSRFALFFGNRGFFPASHMETARREMNDVLQKMGHETLLLDASATRHGAVETPREGQVFRSFLEKNKGKFDGVILSLPNFGDETGAVTALKDAGVPILIQAYPDDLDKMDADVRRDSFCGKFSVMDVFCQYGVKFTALKPHTVHPTSKKFAANIDHFDKICRVVRAFKDPVIGAIGARTTAFKTVRIDELTLQKHRITVETYDLSSVFNSMGKLDDDAQAVKNKREVLAEYSNWNNVPEEAISTLTRLGVVIDDLITENDFDAVSIRCWLEMQQQLKISPCILLSELNERGIPAACELDTGNSVTMYALSAASGKGAACLDWNNNYGDDEDKCILFHCGPVPSSLMAAKGDIIEHTILAKSVGRGCSYGCNVGRIAPNEMTYGSLLTEDGRMKFYLGEGQFTSDKIAPDFFGCAGVAHIENLQDALQKIGYMGFRHHASVTVGKVQSAVQEAFERYLGFDVTAV